MVFQTVSDLFQTSLRISGYSCFPTVSGGFRPVSHLFGMFTNFHTNVGSVDIAACLRFQTVSDLFCFRPLWDVHIFPYKCRISGYSCFPTVSDGLRPVSDLFGMSTNFHTNVGSADIASQLSKSVKQGSKAGQLSKSVKQVSKAGQVKQVKSSKSS